MCRIHSFDRTPLKITQGDAALSSLCSSPSLKKNPDVNFNFLAFFLVKKIKIVLAILKNLYYKTYDSIYVHVLDAYAQDFFYVLDVQYDLSFLLKICSCSTYYFPAL